MPALARSFDAVREKVLTHAARTRVFEKPVDVAINIHDWLFYGDEKTPKVANTNPDQGTNLVYLIEVDDFCFGRLDDQYGRYRVSAEPTVDRR